MAAESEQKRLVAATNAQATYIDNLTKLMRQQAKGKHENIVHFGETSDDSVFQALLKDADESYATTNKLLQECNMDELPIGITNSTHRRKTNVTAMELAFLDEVAAFLDLDNLPTVPVGTPCTSTEDGENQLVLAVKPLKFQSCDSSSDEVEPESIKNSSSDNETASSTATKKIATCTQLGPDNRRKRYRERVKNEREELKEIERQLTMQIQELVNSRERQRAIARPELALSKSFWRGMAAQQQELRMQSETEQMRLVAFIQSQAAYINNLNYVLRAQPGSHITGLVKSSVQPLDNLKWLRLKSSDTALYELYLKEVSESYAQVDRVFEECGMDSMIAGSVSSLRRINSDGSVEYTQYVYKLLQPFCFEDTCNNMWESSKLFHRGIDREVYQDISDSGNTIAFKFRLKRSLEAGSSVSILKRVLARRFYDNGRVVITWKIFSEGEGVFSGMDVDETAWVSIRPCSDEATSGALMEICSRQVPSSFITDNPNDTAVKEFKKMMERAVKEDERESIRILKKLLLEDTLVGIEIEHTT
ncbi:hypothetical protein PHMEG_00025180 [Phytophthora megakarya]|uniref:M96 mating-specific protein n=1 Tax=Phytophthora megakarya TaxID=4795 RepID=A0A225VF71_9STRA|nr:hypothetical protein PHMEG_00025180 [Phytophthora megakarya]